MTAFLEKNVSPRAASVTLAHALADKEQSGMSDVTREYYSVDQLMEEKAVAMKAWSDALIEALLDAGGKLPAPSAQQRKPKTKLRAKTTDRSRAAAVRGGSTSSDDKIVGEVRNIVFGTKDGRDYAIVASGGLFTTGMESIVVPIQSLKVTQDRSSFFLPISKETIKTLPLMPDQDYLWLSDQKWRPHNDAVFKRP
ncbi:PRC-barrel domain-containing protein [Bradyrhizobium cosmicum]|uniref:PRC-barrel domain-containing protein n=1 Tax=Bradyrhizobium cosmicum TaxID=1404864 RepID=UPI003A5CB6B1